MSYGDTAPNKGKNPTPMGGGGKNFGDTHKDKGRTQPAKSPQGGYHT